MNEKAKTVCVCGKEKAWDEELCPECIKKNKMKRKELEKVVTSELVEIKTSPLAIINLAVEKGLDLEKVEKALIIYERWEANKAKKDFVEAMTRFKENPPNVYKDKKNTQFDSMYTSLSGLVNTSIPELSKQGLSHNWDYGTAENGNPSVTCVLTHESGHSISVTQDAAPIQSKNKAGQVVTNPIQQVKCTQTYLKITTFEAVTGLVSKEINLDDDGNARSEVEYIDDKQLHILRDNLIAAEGKEGPLCKHFGIEGLDKLLKSDYQRALVAVKAKKEVKVEK